MEVDKERIVFLIGGIEQALSILGEYGQQEKDALTTDLKSQGQYIRPNSKDLNLCA